MQPTLLTLDWIDKPLERKCDQPCASAGLIRKFSDELKEGGRHTSDTVTHLAQEGGAGVRDSTNGKDDVVELWDIELAKYLEMG